MVAVLPPAAPGTLRRMALADLGDPQALFGEDVCKPEAQSRIQAANKRGFQTRDAQMALARMLGDGS